MNQTFPSPFHFFVYHINKLKLIGNTNTADDIIKGVVFNGISEGTSSSSR